MLNDLRKKVGIKTDKELKAKRYEQNLHGRQEASAEEYFALGNMHQKAGDKQAAVAAFLNAASLALNVEDITIAMAANKAIIHLEPGHKDALANVAYIRFQYGTELVNKEYDELLQELKDRGHSTQHALTTDNGEKKIHSEDSHPGEIDPTEHQPLSDITTESPEPGEAGTKGLTSRLNGTGSHQSLPTHRAAPGANKIPTTDRKPQSEGKFPSQGRPKTGRWKADLQARKKHAYAQRNFEADRKSLVGMIEGTEKEEFSTSFELERRSLVDSVKQQADDVLDESQEEEASPLYLKSESGEDMAEKAPKKALETCEEDQSQVEPDFTIDLRPGEEKDAEQLRLHLQDCTLFSALSDQELQQLVPHVRQHTLSAHTTVIAQDAARRALWLIFDGDVELSVDGGSQQQESSRMNLEAGDFFGEHTFWKQNTMTVAATTRTACTLGEISVPLFFSYARKYPAMLKLLKNVCKRRYFGIILDQSYVFQECSLQERQRIAEYLSPIHVTRGVPILPEGECTQDLFIIQSGEVNVSTTLVEEGGQQKIIQDTHEQVSLDKLSKGDVFGEESFFTHSPCFSAFWAFTDVLLLKLPGPHLAAFAEQCPQFKHRLQSLHQQRSQATMEAIQAVLIEEASSKQ